jgi:predicted nucleic acid-binding protein
VLRHPGIEEIVTTETTLAEVQEYASHLAQKRRLSVDVVLLALATLPVTTVPREAYASCLAAARKRIGGRDPDDVELLALAIKFGVPVWSNDNDFESAGIPWYTTARLLECSGQCDHDQYSRGRSARTSSSFAMCRSAGTNRRLRGLFSRRVSRSRNSTS